MFSNINLLWMLLSHFFIKTITHWPPLYASRSCSYSIMKLLPIIKTSWSNFPFQFVIIKFFHPCYPFLHFTWIMMTTMVVKLQFQIEFFEFPKHICVGKHMNQLTLESKNWRHNDHWFNYNDNMHVTFLKTSFRF